VKLLSELMGELDGWKEIAAVSGWRSLREQQELYAESLRENGEEFTRQYVALPNHSEHQTGLAVDLGVRQGEIDFIRPEFPYSGVCQRFRERAARFGFVERYPKGKEEVTGIAHEPWHFRYVGTPHAEIMAEHGMVLEEYIDFLKPYVYGRGCYSYQTGNLDIKVSYLEAEKTGETRLEIDGDAAILQTTVASDDHAAVDGNVEGKLCLGLDEGHGNAALAVLDVHATESPEKSTADLERKVVGTVFQPFVSNGISFRCIHLNTNSAQSYEKIRHLQRKRRDVFYN